MAKPKKPGTGVTNKRRKALAAAKMERQHARRAEREARRRRRRNVTWGVVGLVAVLAVVGYVLWPSSSGQDVATAPPASPAPSGSPSPVDIGCDPAPTPPAEPKSYEAAPGTVIDADQKYTLTLTTNCGEITIETLTAKAPKTVNAILSLADDGFYDDTLCHRLTTGGIKVLQCGDPTATGSGGPGFTIPDENLPKQETNNYPRGTVAMANSGANTAGSQFFIVYQDTTLPNDYTIWGTVTEGLDVVEKVAGAGVADGTDDGRPAASIGILSTTVAPPLG